MKTKQPKPIHWKKKIPEGTFSIFFQYYLRMVWRKRINVNT